MVAQCLGAICGVGLVKWFMKTPYNRLGGGANLVAPGYNKGTALGAEIIGTFVLVYTVFSATDPKRSARDSHVPVCITCIYFVSVFVLSVRFDSWFGYRCWLHCRLGSQCSWFTQPRYRLLEPGSTRLGALERLLSTTMGKFGMIM